MPFMRFTSLTLAFALLFSRVHSQWIDTNYLGTWINIELQEEIRTHKSIDSLYKVLPRFLYINNSREFKVQYKFEQTLKNHKISGKKGQRLYYKDGFLQF